MPKLKLVLDDLSVQSFEISPGALADGTVHGHSDPTDNGPLICSNRPNCQSGLCTQDPGDAYCYDSMHFCVETGVTHCRETCNGDLTCNC